MQIIMLSHCSIFGCNSPNLLWRQQFFITNSWHKSHCLPRVIHFNSRLKKIKRRWIWDVFLAGFHSRSSWLPPPEPKMGYTPNVIPFPCNSRAFQESFIAKGRNRTEPAAYIVYLVVSFIRLPPLGGMITGKQFEIVTLIDFNFRHHYAEINPKPMRGLDETSC